MITNLDLYKILFIVEIIIAEFLFTFRLKKKKKFLLRYSLSLVLLLLITILIPIISVDALFSSFLFFFLFFLSIIMLLVCYDEPVINIIFCGVASYTMQHFSYELSNLVLSLINAGQSPLLGMYGEGEVQIFTFTEKGIFMTLVYFLCYLSAYWLLFLWFGKKIKKSGEMKIKSIWILYLIGAGLIINIILNAIVVYSPINYENNLLYFVCYIYNLLCCVLLLFGQFSLLYTRELQSEIDIINHLWHQEKMQYQISKENIELINIKCHDMKHQIRSIVQNNSLSDKTIKDIENSISLYDANVKTGNEVLDIVLTEKSLICNKNSIVMSYIIDGEKLNFMDEGDIYSLFGNALDNAIEAVLKIDDKNKRIISIKIHQMANFITINISNTYIGTIELNEEGLPMTTKDNANYHGFGMKSISYIVDKYEGDLSFVVNEGIFNLNMLLKNK